MKISTTLPAIFLLLAAAFTKVNAQKKMAEGTITYKIAYELPADQQQEAAMLPNEITCYFRGDSSAAVFSQGQATMKGVSVFKSNFHSLIIDVPSTSKKIFVVLTPQEVEQEIAANPQFTGIKGSEKQVIVGYNCIKTTITDTKSGAKYDIWLTNDIDTPPNSVSKLVSGFGGVPVKFVTFNRGIKIDAELKEVKAGPVPAGFFSPTKEYESMSYADLKAMSGGGN
jgi:hypothetical protein